MTLSYNFEFYNGKSKIEKRSKNSSLLKNRRKALSLEVRKNLSKKKKKEDLNLYIDSQFF